jgi:hypothetical protein
MKKLVFAGIAFAAGAWVATMLCRAASEDYFEVQQNRVWRNETPVGWN